MLSNRILQTALFLFLFLITCFQVISADITWDGSESTDWCDGLNWVGDAVPDSGDDVIINDCSGGNCPVITVANCGTSATARKITINTDGTLTVQAELTGDNNLEIAGGTLIVNNPANIHGFNDIKFKQPADGGTYTQDGGTVVMDTDFKIENGSDNNTLTVTGGTFTVGASFEMRGDNNNITFNSNDATANITIPYIQTYGGAYDTGHNEAGDGTGNTINVTGSSTNFSITEIDLGTTDNIPADENVLNFGDNINYTGAANPLDLTNVFGDDANDGNVTVSSVPLPVNLLWFRKVASDDRSITLSWLTSAEVNNDYYTLYRSDDGQEFYEISRLDGAGNYDGKTTYLFTDHSPLTGTSYYKLRQTDFDGKYEDLKVISVARSLLKPTLSVYPSSVSHELILRSRYPMQKVLITNLSGNTLISNFSGQVYRIDLDVSHLIPGFYLVKVDTEERVETIKFIKQ